MLDDNPSYTALLRELLLSAYGGACNQAVPQHTKPLK